MPEITDTETVYEDGELGLARAFLAELARRGEEYAGLPLGVSDERLVVHPSYKWAHVVNRKPEPSEEDPEWELVNHWPSLRLPGSEIGIWKHKQTGRVVGGRIPAKNRLTMQFSTMGLASVWDIHAERKAIDKLASLIKPHAFRAYMLTGSFLERSKRSDIVYLFRRLRPTLAIKADDSGCRCLAGLCLHPIGYYEGTWAGCMVPTDEVVAHLMLMRGDEHDFWKQANQHPAWRAESGL